MVRSIRIVRLFLIKYLKMNKGCPRSFPLSVRTMHMCLITGRSLSLWEKLQKFVLSKPWVALFAARSV